MQANLMCYLTESSQPPVCERQVLSPPPHFRDGQTKVQKGNRGEEGPGNGSCKDHRTQKFIADQETALWREENEGGEWGPLHSLSPTAAQVRTTGPSGGTSGRKESLASTK